MGPVVSKFLYLPPTPRYDLLTFAYNLIFIPKNLTIVGSETESIPCLYIHNETATKFLIYCHGNATDLGNIYRECTLLSHLLNVHVLAVEYPGYGLHYGKPSEVGLIETLQCVVSFVVASMRVSYSDLVFYGRSLGTAVCTAVVSDLCINHTPPAALILQSPFSSIKRLVGDLVHMNFFMGEVFDTAHHMQFVSCPVQVIHCAKDELIPRSHIDTVYEAIPHSLRDLHVADDADHNVFNLYEDVIAPMCVFINRFCRNPDFAEDLAEEIASNSLCVTPSDPKNVSVSDLPVDNNSNSNDNSKSNTDLTDSSVLDSNISSNTSNSNPLPSLHIVMQPSPRRLFFYNSRTLPLDPDVVPVFLDDFLFRAPELRPPVDPELHEQSVLRYFETRGRRPLVLDPAMSREEKSRIRTSQNHVAVSCYIKSLHER